LPRILEIIRATTAFDAVIYIYNMNLKLQPQIKK